MTRPKTAPSSSEPSIVIAGAQFAVVPNDIPTNLYRCIYFLRRAVEDTGAKLLVFPESITTGFNPALSPRDLYELLPPTDAMLSPVQSICKELKIHCVLPTYERGSSRGVVYNSAFLIDSRGQNLGCYRKTHLFPTERKENKGWTTPGHHYPVFKTEIGTIGIHVAVNAIGSDAAHTTYFGHSMIVSPIAQTLALGRAVDDLIYARMDPNPLLRVSYGSDAPMLFDHLEDRTVRTYTRELFAPAISPFNPSRRGAAPKEK